MKAELAARGYSVREAYEAIPRRVLQQEGISARALGVLVYLLSKPDGWSSSATRLAEHFEEGRDAIEKALKTLETLGYLGRRRVRYPNGQCGWVWVYGDDPEFVAAHLDRKVAEVAALWPVPTADTSDTSPQVGPNPEKPNSVEPNTVEPNSVEPNSVDQGSYREDREEKTEREKEGGVLTAVGHQLAGTEPPPPSLPAADWRDPASWMCREHLAQFRDDPGADRPPCGKCARVREWAQQQQAEHQRAAAEAEQTAVDVTADCRMHDEFGWRVDPVTREPLGVAIKCDHVTPHVEIVHRVLAAKAAEPVAASSESVRAAAMASVRSLAAKRRNSRPGFPDQGVSGHTDHVEARTG